MLSRYTNKLLRYSYSRAICHYRSFASANIETDPTRDPAPFFFDKEIQTYLQTLTTLDYNKVFRARKDGHKLKTPEYKFLTNEQLQKTIETAEKKAKRYLQMPPVVKSRVNPTVPLCEDPALQGFNSSKFVFTDITFGAKVRKRFIVVREPDGSLRQATWEERDRLIQNYFPQPGKEPRKPKMFEEKYLEDLLNRNEYEFILDRACVQFEPDDPVYQMITRKVYEHINREKHFDILRSTRHFGPMVFHLVWTENIENLLCEMIETGRIKHAALLIRLYHKIHPTSESAIKQCDDSDDIEFILHYTHLDSPGRSKIEKLVQSYKELQQQHEIVAEGIKKAHGISPETDKM